MIKGAKELNGKFNKLLDLDATALKAVEKETTRVKETAKLLCPVNHGELRQSIQTKTEIQKDTIRGICYTNKEHASYVEFGTGPVGEANHSGISPNVQPTYTQQGWWIPGDAVTEMDADKYHWPKSEGDDQTFFYTNGQPAQPFMYPALKMNERIIKMNLATKLKTQIRNVGKS